MARPSRANPLAATWLAPAYPRVALPSAASIRGSATSPSPDGGCLSLRTATPKAMETMTQCKVSHEEVSVREGHGNRWCSPPRDWHPPWLGHTAATCSSDWSPTGDRRCPRSRRRRPAARRPTAQIWLRKFVFFPYMSIWIV